MALDYYNTIERSKQRLFASTRDRFLAPLVKRLEQLGVSANMITLASVLSLLIAAIFGPEQAYIAALFIAIYCLLDGLDGPLARATGRDCDGGALIEIAADQLGVILLPAVAIIHLGADGFTAVLFSNFYVGFIVLAVFCNSKGIAIPHYIRVKYPFYLVYLLSLYHAKDWVSLFMAIFIVYYAVMIWWSLVRVYAVYQQQKRANLRG
uniref:CDP-alcohol phosphatidyltransferase n=1 Tax=Magnetococcus massalia (strain MO-1) TaxID=451514 RepID=A0A1S7LF23_MAGMO|nr:Membrane protein of unknown function. Putative phosphatidyltransferase [Candidatus Magnetococcus massalia]